MADTGFVSYLKDEVFRDFPEVSFRPMFGGYGLYKDGKIFGMIASDKLYFKVDNSNRPDYEKASMGPFVYVNKGKSYSMSYWEVPQAVLDDSEILSQWLTKSLAIKKK